MRGLTAVSLFAGVGGIDLALERAGVHVTAAVEINPAARGVIAEQRPDIALFDDVTKVSPDELRATGFVPERGILAGGFPCQDLSVAGRRAGLGGARSGLFWHIMRLADARVHPREHPHLDRRQQQEARMQDLRAAHRARRLSPPEGNEGERRMTPQQDAESYSWPALTPAAYLEDALTFCRCGSLLKDATFSRARCGVNCLGVAAA